MAKHRAEGKNPPTNVLRLIAQAEARKAAQKPKPRVIPESTLWNRLKRRKG